MEHKPTQWKEQTYQMKIVTNKAQTYQMKKVTNRAQTYQIKIVTINERGTDLPNEDGTVLNLPNLTTSARGGYGQRSLLPYRFFYFHMY